MAADRLGEILDLEAEKKENEQRKMAPESLAGDIKFEHVNFRYGTRQLVLEDIDFTIKKGEKIAFVGEMVQERQHYQSSSYICIRLSPEIY